MIRGIFACVMMFVLVVPTYATPPTRPREPKSRFIVSDNRKFTCEILPPKKLLVVDNFFNGPAPLWTVSYDVKFDECFISNDGNVVGTLLAGVRGAPELIGVRFWTKNGELKNYRLDQLLDDPRSYSKISTGFFSDNNWFTGARMIDDEFRVVTLEGKHIAFSLKTGEQLRSHRPLLAGWSFCETFSLFVVVIAAVWIGTILCLAVATVYRRSRPD